MMYTHDFDEVAGPVLLPAEMRDDLDDRDVEKVRAAAMIVTVEAHVLTLARRPEEGERREEDLLLGGEGGEEGDGRAASEDRVGSQLEHDAVLYAAGGVLESDADVGGRGLSEGTTCAHGYREHV